VTEAYAMLTISCMINLRFLKWGSFSIGMMSVFAILTTVFLTAFPAYLYWLLKTNFQSLELRSFKKKYSAFYEELELRNGEMVLLQPIWFLLRRLMLAVMVVFLNTAVIWQIALMTANVITQVIILGLVQPFVLPSKTRYELFSECVVMLVMDHMICFTPFVADLGVRFGLGYSVCTVLSVHLAYCFGILIKTTLQDLKRKYRLYYAGKDHDKQRTELRKRLAKRAPSIREKRLEKRKRLVAEREKRENELLE